ncbi:MAG: TetR/AcrR family transcriptional regulator [Pseudomonadota bacterium]
MSTRDRILDAALQLFNTEGEANVTAVDIANALSISPGNLYYHFKGKPSIIEALFDRFEEEFLMVLNAPISSSLSLDDNWVYTYILLEEIHDFEFFYKNLDSLLLQYPELRTRFRRILQRKEATVKSILETLRRSGHIDAADTLIEALARHITLTLTYHLNMEAIVAAGLSSKLQIHHTVYQIMCLICPFLGEHRQAMEQLMNAYYDDVLKRTPR